MAQIIARLFGGSQPTRIEYSLVDIHNDCVEQASMDTTVCLTPRIVNGALEFTTSPLLENESTQGSGGYNILGHLRNTINVKQDECIVIMNITRTHVHNELDVDLDFNINNVFDHDPATEAVRNKIDAAVQMREAEAITVNVPKVAPKKKPSPSQGLESVYDVDPLIDAVPSVGRRGLTAEEVLSRADNVTVRGRHVHRNATEASNVIHVGTIPANTTVFKTRVLYKASIAHNIVKWFAGQDAMVQMASSHVHRPISSEISTPNMNEATRTIRPIIYSEIYPDSHSLVMFIRMFADDLDVQEGEIVFLDGDRGGDEKWCKIDRELVKRARDMILYVVYAQMYYTTLRDCTFERIVDETSAANERALVMKIASRWKLYDEKTKEISDWLRGAYRPQVIITLHVEYFIVRRSSASAAALHKNLTTLRGVQ